MGESTQEKKAKDVYGQVDNTVNDFKGQDLSLGDYRSFSADDMLGNVNSIYDTGMKTGTDLINKTFSKDINRAESNMGERLMSRGLNKGSVFNNAVAGAGEGLKGARYNAEQELTAGLTADKAKSTMGVQQFTNQMDQGDAQYNSLAKLRKYNAILDGLNSKLSSVSMMDNTNTWDDILAGLNTAGNVATGGANLIDKAFS